MQRNGIIIRNESNSYVVEDCSTNEIINCGARGKFKEKNLNPTVGDFVHFSIIGTEQGEGIIEEILPRDNYIKRPRIANLTQIVYVVSMKLPKPDFLLLDKQLIFAELNNVRPIICFNKIDLVSNEYLEHYEKIYRDIGYNVVKTDANKGEGVVSLKEMLKGHITAFSGNSGVGKSTLVNGIFGDNLTKQGSISEKNKRGKNTTTATSLYKLDNSSYIADTPGFSTFDITEIEKEELYKYFKEFNKYVDDCEFIGCTHIKEQTCGIKKAVEKELISEERYNSYCKIYNEIKEREEHKW